MNLKKNNVHILQDETVMVGDKFYITGRQDATVHDRKSTEELLAALDKSHYIVLLDHQPLEYSEADKAGADSSFVRSYSWRSDISSCIYEQTC